MKRRLEVIILILIIAVIPLGANASTMSTTFFNNTKLGYRRVGTGSLSGQSYSAQLTVTALPGTVVQPEENYSSDIWVLLYHYPTSESSFEAHHVYGNMTCLVSGTTNGYPVYSSFSTFSFEGSDLGGYALYN